MVKKLLFILGMTGLASARRRSRTAERKPGFPWWGWALVIAVPMGVIVNRLLRRRAMQQPQAVAPARASIYRVQVADMQVENISPVVQDIPLPIERTPWPTAEAQKTQAVAAAQPAPASPAASPDDLTVIEGIGPVIAGVLNQAGIVSLAQLAETEVSRLQQILREAGIRLGDPQTWPEQAKLAAAGDWEGFNALTEQLKGGRRS